MSPMIWPERYRKQIPGYESLPHDRAGVFVIQHGMHSLFCIAVEDSGGWDHVSVSLRLLSGKPLKDPGQCPAWRTMCMVKDLFWTKDSVVIQFHPAKADYVNNHPGVLHLWRWRGGEFPKPPKEFV